MRPCVGREPARAGGVAARLRAVGAGFGLLALLPVAAPCATVVRQVRHWTAPDHTRIVLDLSDLAAYEVRQVAAPPRIAINVTGARFATTAERAVGDGLVRRIRCNALVGRAQVVLDLDLTGRFRHFRLPAEDGHPPRIVVDVFRDEPGATRQRADEAKTGGGDVQSSPVAGVDGTSPAAADQLAPAAESAAPSSSAAPFTVVIDAGHGGMDPGAMRAGLREKDFTLAVALELARRIEAQPGWRAVLTRRGDYFVSLAERVRIARREKGDVFISLHLNTHPRRATAGMEVYFLSLQGATDREAQELADKENAADLVGLAPDDAQDDSVLSILMDLRMARVLDQSSQLAEAILGATRRCDFLGARRVKQARFQVLRSLAMPSALVELAYLSNEGDRALLESGTGTVRLARLLVDGLAAYRGQPGPRLVAAAGTVTAEGGVDTPWGRRYRVRRGDTLWQLAREHGTTIAEICARNRLGTPEIRVGQRLRLPGNE